MPPRRRTTNSLHNGAQNEVPSQRPARRQSLSVNPSTTKVDYTHGTKLNQNKIAMVLLESDDDDGVFHVGKNLNNPEFGQILTIKRLPTNTYVAEIKNKMGLDEETRPSNSSRCLRRKSPINLNEDYLAGIHESDCVAKIYGESKKQTAPQTPQANGRKRSVQSKSPHLHDIDSESEVDENEAANANTNKSPKRKKSEDTPKKQTPAKNSIKPVQNTPAETPTSRRQTRFGNQEGTPQQTPKKPAQVLDTPTTANRPNRKSRQNLFTSTEHTPVRSFQNLNLNSPGSRTRSAGRSNLTAKLATNRSKSAGQPRSTPSGRTSRNDGRKISVCSDHDEDDNYTPGNESESSEDDTDTEESESDDCSDDSYCPGPKQKRKISRTLTKTPSKKSLKTPLKNSRLSMTPAVCQRTVNIVKPSTPLQEARVKLHVSVLPKSLPCREEQFNDIYTFLHARLSDGSGGCIYISGVPGTGKTATVNEVIRCLKKSRDSRQLADFEFVDINGMKLSEPRQAYVQIWKQLTGNSVTWEAAHKLLQARFVETNAKRGMTLLLVDELDLLCNKRQDVVYNLLDWPSKLSARLVVVTIANTMDLPERILMGKVTSRLGLTRLTFPPYNYKQLEEIVVSRLKGFNAFSGETIQLVARKVAAVSGDARRALDICRRATEVAENNNREMVSMIDVKTALDEMIASPKIQAIKHCSDFEKVFLQAVCGEVTRTGVEEVVFKNVYYQFDALCTLNGEKAPNVTEALQMCSRLGSWRLLLCEHSRADIHQRILLNVSPDDVHFATQPVDA